MKPYFSFLLLLFFVSSVAASFNPSTMVLRGRGEIRYLGFIKVYEAALYTAENVTRATLLDASSSRCLKLTYGVDLTVEDFIEAAEKVLAKQHEETSLGAVQKEIDQLHANYQEVKEGDIYTLCYESSSQETKLLLNSDVLVTIKSAEFARIYFGIWLGEKEPLSESLRKNLLTGLQ